MVAVRRLGRPRWLALKLLILSCTVLLVETAMPKMRLFRVPS